MMPLPELFLALFVLLLTPGPTNTLLAIAGAERGAVQALKLIPVEAAAYLLTTVPLALIGAELLATFPALRSVITFAACLWVAWLAVKMWQLPAEGSNALPHRVSGARVFTTTLLNPKALIIGFALLPAQSGLPLRVILFVSLIACVAALWAFIGSTISRRASASHLPLVRRCCACWLGVLSLGLAVAGFQA